jgi:hypothetical protein
MTQSIVHDVPVLKEYGISESDLETLLDVMPMYGRVNNKGQLDDSEKSPFTDDGILDSEEKPEKVGRKGESELSFGYDDFQYHFERLIDGESSGNVSDDEVLDLPEENRREAAGALFGASYAVFRNQVAQEGYPAEHHSFEQDIESHDEKKLFFEEGALEIQGEIMGSWGYDHETMNEIMDADAALKAYNSVAEEML